MRLSVFEDAKPRTCHAAKKLPKMLPVGEFFRLRRATETVLWATDNAIVRGCMACGAETMHVSGQARVDDRTLGLTLCQCSVGGTKHATSLGPREGAHRGAARLLGRESTLVASRPVEPSALCAGAWIVY